MEDQDGISVRPMRLKVLYTFDDESKTNCLARWPHLLEIQTAFLDEETQVGVIELKTCIQAIVSASPELVAKLGRDYTVYAYDYSEYETPLVGQGMLSWVLASASPTPNAPAHQSKTMVTGRVCQNAGLFARSAQETLEVKLKLVPVPTILQSEYLDSMQRYRELSTVIPQDFDSQAWTNFVQANPGLLGDNNAQPGPERDPTGVNRSGIENVHRILSEGATSRDFSNMGNFPADSAAQFTNCVPSRTSTPGIARPASQPQRRVTEESIRPSSRDSMHNVNSRSRRRGSMMSGYGSSDEVTEGPVPKRAKLMRANLDKANLNIERQPGSLRVAASTAASVRIHRPTPLNPAIPTQTAADDPVRPPTPIPSMANAPNRRVARAESGLRRQSSTFSQHSQASVYAPDDRRPADFSAMSPEDQRYGVSSETPFNMPSSPPVMDMTCPQTSSPVLPPFHNHDSGFMSGHIEPLDDDDNNTDYNAQRRDSSDANVPQLAPKPGMPIVNEFQAANQQTNQHMSDGILRNSTPVLPPQRRKTTVSRPSSRASFRQTSKLLAPAPVPTQQNDMNNSKLALPPVPASDPIRPGQYQPSRPQAQSCPMSDMHMESTPAPTGPSDGKGRSGAGARRVKQVQARLDQCIKQGTVPPYCENCGAIETTTWRRAWSKVIEGNADDANSHVNDNGMLFWEAVDTESDGTITSYKQFKKSLANEDKDYIQLLLCNPCGLWLHKFKNMRPENKWNKQAAKDKRKRKSNRRPPAVPAASTRSQSRILAAKRSESSPPPTESSSPNDEEITPKNGAGSGSTGSQSRPSNRRANSAEPPKSSNKNDRWQQEDAFEALRRAIQSSPARNLEKRNVPYKEPNLTPNPVRRTLFQSAKDDTAMKALSEALINSVRRSPRSSPRKSKSTSNPEINTHAPGDGLDHLFEGENEEFVDLDPPHSPTPRQKTSAANAQAKNKENIATPSKQPSKRNDPANQQAPGQELSSTKTKNDGSGMSTYWNSPNSRSFETIDGLVLNIFETDEDSFQTFSHPKTSSNSNWLDWDPSDYVSPGTTAEGITRGQNEMSNAAATSTSEDSNSKEAPHDAGGSMTVEDTEFRSLLLASANDFANFNCSTELSDSDIFDSSLVDPQLFSSMWAKESAITTSPADEKNDGMDQFDPDVISAIIQEVTGRPDTT